MDGWIDVCVCTYVCSVLVAVCLYIVYGSLLGLLILKRVDKHFRVEISA